MSVVLAAQPIPTCPPPPYVASRCSPDQAQPPPKRPAYRRFLTSSRRIVLKRIDSAQSSDPSSSSSSSSSSLQSPAKRFSLSLPALIATAKTAAAGTQTTVTRPRAATTSELVDTLRSACYVSTRRLSGLLVDTPAGRRDSATTASADVLLLQPCSDTHGIAKPCRACHQGERCSQLGSRPPRRSRRPVSEYTLSYRYPADDAVTTRNDDDADESTLL